MRDKEFCQLLKKVEVELDKLEKQGRGQLAMHQMIEVIAPELNRHQINGLVDMVAGYKKRARERQLQTGAQKK